MKCLTDSKALAGLNAFTILQFETVWAAALEANGVVQGEVKAGVSHPDFGKKWNDLKPHVREFISRLCVLRSIHFTEMAKSGELTKLMEMSSDEIPKDRDFQVVVARRLHDDWVLLRAVMYTPFDDATRQSLVEGGLKPFGDHEGDKPWDAETEAQQGNDLRLVYSLGWLLNYCQQNEDPNLKAYFASLFDGVQLPVV